MERKREPSTPSAAAGERTDESTMISARYADISKEDEMLPKGAQQVKQQDTGGEERDTAGEHGDMRPESAGGLAGPARTERESRE